MTTLSVQFQSPSLKTLVLSVCVFHYYFKIASEAISRDLIDLELLMLRYLRKSKFWKSISSMDLELNLSSNQKLTEGKFYITMPERYNVQVITCDYFYLFLKNLSCNFFV